VTPVTPEYGATVPEKLGASAGVWAALWILVHYLILRSASADPLMPDYDYVRTLVSERMTWESATAFRVMGGLMIIWFMGSLAGRLRLVEGEPGRLASISSAVGIVWGAVWLLSAMFNSAAILLATQYNNPEGARLLGMLARESVLILTPSIVFVLSLAVAFVALRFGGFSKAYTYTTAAFTVLILVLAIIDWYGPGNLAPAIMTLALAWLALTSALTVPTYRPADMVRGAR
jgi:hypothetical protein